MGVEKRRNLNSFPALKIFGTNGERVRGTTATVFSLPNLERTEAGAPRIKGGNENGTTSTWPREKALIAFAADETQGLTQKLA